MSSDAREFIDGYLDETLTAEQQHTLGEWIKAAPENARQFAAAALLHDRLRSEHIAMAVEHDLDASTKQALSDTRRHIGDVFRWRRFVTAGCVMAAALLVVIAVWNGWGESRATAAIVELNRIIEANSQSTDRTYQVTVEEVTSPRRGEREDSSVSRRPPKPPLDGAVLHVRGRDQFVLIRQTTDGAPFVTGCNGTTSWAVRPDGPVRFSTDRTRFNRDLPGHEHSMPLNNIHDGLARLREAYETQLLPVEPDDSPNENEPTRLIVAVKKRGVRGPRRVEISYAAESGLIRQLRFIDMPYGPERLTLQMTLVAEQPLGEQFFHHESHHDAGREVVEE